MARHPKWHATLSAARDEAVLAVRLYNDTYGPRAFEGFVVHMHLAWLYLLHACFLRDGTEFRYRDRKRPRRFVKVDGEYKRWELARCVQERWSNSDDPIRKNIEFFIALRNRVEHRHTPTSADLALSVAGHAQAHLLNFEEELVKAFGHVHSLGTTLRFPVFIGSFTTEGAEALAHLRSRLPAELRTFIGEFHSGLADDLLHDSRFELRLRVVLEQVQRDPEALAIQFTRWDDLTDDQKMMVEELGRRGQAIVREQKRPVVGHGLLRPHEVELQVAMAIPFVFNSNHFLRARRIKRIRPATGDAHPERTDERYCVYDEFSRSYGYTEAWAKYLIKRCSTEQGFREATGRDPAPKKATPQPSA
jgi:hypothetical protein